MLNVHRIAAIFLITALVGSLSGCTLCCSPYDFDYMSTGTRYQRTDMVNGRVGSSLSDPNMGGVIAEEGVLYEDSPMSEEVIVEEIEPNR